MPQLGRLLHSPASKLSSHYVRMHARVSSRLTSFQKQSLLLEFAALRHARLDGLYVSIASEDPTLWLGVIFVRKGPYAPAVLRFQISFPPNYPALPPLVTFSSDIFHPFLTPLTTYTYTTGATDSDTVSATDEERLPPGGFSLRHGFPHWFARASRSATSSRTASGQGPDRGAAASPSPSRAPGSDSGLGPGSDTAAAATAQRSAPEDQPRYVAVAEVLKYMQASFTDEALLDSVTLATAANPGAYHAWRTYRRKDLGSQSASPAPDTRTADTTSPSRSRRPGEWNWEGVWEDRVRKGIQASLSDPVMFGGGTDEIHFLSMDNEELGRLKKDIELSVST